MVMEIEEEYVVERKITFSKKDDELEIYFELSEEERDLLDEYIVDEVYFDDEGSPPSFLVIRFRKR